MNPINTETNNTSTEQSTSYAAEIKAMMMGASLDVEAMRAQLAEEMKTLPAFQRVANTISGTLVGTEHAKRIPKTFDEYKSKRKRRLAKVLVLEPGKIDEELQEMTADLEAKTLLAAGQIIEKLGTLGAIILSQRAEMIRLGDISSDDILEDLARGKIWLSDGKQRWDIMPLVYDAASKLLTRHVIRPFNPGSAMPSIFSKDGLSKFVESAFPTNSEPAFRANPSFEKLLVTKSITLGPDELNFVSAGGDIYAPADAGAFLSIEPQTIKNSKGALLTVNYKYTAKVDCQIFYARSYKIEAVYDETYLLDLIVEAASRQFGANVLTAKSIATTVGTLYDIVTNKYPKIMDFTWVVKLKSAIDKALGSSTAA